MHRYCRGRPDIDRVDRTDAMLATLPASLRLSSSSSFDLERLPCRGVGGSVLIGGGFTIPDGRPPCRGVVSNEFRPARVSAPGGSRRGPWLRFERALSGWPEYASGRRPWPRALPALMVGGSRRLARVLGVSMGFCGAAVAMVAAVGRCSPFQPSACAELRQARYPAAAAGVADAEAAAALSWPGGSLTMALPWCAHRNRRRLCAARGLALQRTS